MNDPDKKKHTTNQTSPSRLGPGLVHLATFSLHRERVRLLENLLGINSLVEAADITEESLSESSSRVGIGGSGLIVSSVDDMAIGFSMESKER
jgi:hypothetical protein